MITISPTEPHDLPGVAALLEELDRYYGDDRQPVPVDQRLEQMKALLLRDVPAAHVLVARDDSYVVGLASYSFHWPAAGITQSLFVKELYVREAYRQRGIGRQLIQAVCRTAVKQGCSRVEWMADNDNPTALRFYAGLGVSPRADKLVYRLEGDQLREAQQPPA